MNTNDMEKWKPIPDYENLYEVSSYGRVKSLEKYRYNNGGKQLLKERILRPINNGNGYFMVRLYKNKTNKYYLIHRLVAEAFIPNPDNLPMINHRDEDKTNNVADNLEWCDAKYNSNYGTAIERTINTKIEKGYYNKELCFLDSKERKKLYNKQYKQEHKELHKEYMREYRKRKRG